jgi:hypothetical protein
MRYGSGAFLHTRDPPVIGFSTGRFWLKIAFSMQLDDLLRGNRRVTRLSTVTQNLNYRTSAHRDAGDCRAGMGVITINRSGSFYGGALCFPEYRCAVRVEEGDVLLADVHALHGNRPILTDPNAERLASAFYVLREANRVRPPSTGTCSV